MTEHLKMNAIYWGLSALDLLDALPEPKFAAQIQDFVLSCQNTDGGFGGAKYHDSHMLYTTSAVQIAVILGFVDKLNADGVVSCLPVKHQLFVSSIVLQ